MNVDPYYEMQAEERYRDLQREIAHDLLVASLPRRQSLWRRGVHLLGHSLIALGTRLERSAQLPPYGPLSTIGHE